MAGDEGFEPPITGPEPVALPLGQSPVFKPAELIHRRLFIIVSYLTVSELLMVL